MVPPLLQAIPPLVVTRQQRDVLFDAVKTNLTLIGDVSTLLEQDRGFEALEVRRQVEDDMRLLDDLGWGHLDPREAYALTMPADQLARTIRRFEALAAGSLEDFSEDMSELALSEDDRDDLVAEVDSDLDLMSACRSVLNSIGAPR